LELELFPLRTTKKKQAYHCTAAGYFPFNFHTCFKFKIQNGVSERKMLFNFHTFTLSMERSARSLGTISSKYSQLKTRQLVIFIGSRVPFCAVVGDSQTVTLKLAIFRSISLLVSKLRHTYKILQRDNKHTVF
jgi:hypothetical protein